MRPILMLAAAMVLVPGSALAQTPVERGEQAFKMCTACHSVGENAANRMGPALSGVIGQPAATRPGFAYSQALQKKSAEGLVWTPETLTQFLHKPRDMVPGTKMSFAGISDDAKIADIIAYLATFSPDYVPEEADKGSTKNAPAQ